MGLELVHNPNEHKSVRYVAGREFDILEKLPKDSNVEHYVEHILITRLGFDAEKYPNLEEVLNENFGGVNQIIKNSGIEGVQYLKSNEDNVKLAGLLQLGIAPYLVPENDNTGKNPNYVILNFYSVLDGDKMDKIMKNYLENPTDRPRINYYLIDAYHEYTYTGKFDMLFDENYSLYKRGGFIRKYIDTGIDYRLVGDNEITHENRAEYRRLSNEWRNQEKVKQL